MKVKPYIKLLRPNVCLLAVIGLLFAIFILRISLSVMKISFSLLAAFILCGAGNVINDVIDVETDKINKPHRPIPSGNVKRKDAILFFFGLLVVGLFFSFLVSVPFLLFSLFSLVIFALYPLFFKRLPGIKNITVAFLSTTPFLAAIFITNRVSFSPLILVFVIIAFLGTLAREIMKDIEDVEGDRKVGIKTLPIIFGLKKARILADVILIFACISLAYPLALSLLSFWYLLGAIPSILFCGYSLVLKNIEKAQKNIKIAMFFVLIGFLLGTLL